MLPKFFLPCRSHIARQRFSLEGAFPRLDWFTTGSLSYKYIYRASSTDITDYVRRLEDHHLGSPRNMDHQPRRASDQLVWKNITPKCTDLAYQTFQASRFVQPALQLASRLPLLVLLLLNHAWTLGQGEQLVGYSKWCQGFQDSRHHHPFQLRSRKQKRLLPDLRDRQIRTVL